MKLHLPQDITPKVMDDRAHYQTLEQLHSGYCNYQQDKNVGLLPLASSSITTPECDHGSHPVLRQKVYHQTRSSPERDLISVHVSCHFESDALHNQPPGGKHGDGTTPIHGPAGLRPYPSPASRSGAELCSKGQVLRTTTV